MAVVVPGESELGMLSIAETRLEVWGDPIAHSRSPHLHAAAYRVLGLEWRYDRRRVDEASFAAQLQGLDRSYRGLSLTMPLKGVAFAAAATRDRRSELTGAVNTLLLGDGIRHGFNTDIGGMVRDLQEQGVRDLSAARVVGAGATATSALVALVELGARVIHVAARRPDAVAALQTVGDRLGVDVHREGMDAAPRPAVEVTVATLPGGAELPVAVADSLAAGGGLLYDVVYGQWPTALAQAWDAGRAVAGHGMLLQQALLQVRVFVTGDPASAVPGEDRVLAAMRAAAAVED